MADEDHRAPPKGTPLGIGGKGGKGGTGGGGGKGRAEGKGGTHGGRGRGEGKGSGPGGNRGRGGRGTAAVPPLRLLCLHGGRQTSDIFRDRLDGLCRRCRSGLAELTFLDGPHELLVPGDTAPTRGWMTDDRAGSMPLTLAYLERQWRDASPGFDGVIAFSQGASAAAAMAARPARFAGLRLAIIACCPATPRPDDPAWGSDELQLPAAVASLHVWSAHDALVPATDSEALHACAFAPGAAEEYAHEKGHAMPCAQRDVDAYAAFLTRHRLAANGAPPPYTPF